MSDLAHLQACMASAVLSGAYDLLAEDIRPGPIAAAEALAVHRNTALYGLVNALRLDHPTVDALVGADFFDRAAGDYARAHPPASAWLTGYGEGFAEFLEGYGPASGLPYLGDVARLDLAIEAVGGETSGVDGRGLDLGEVLLVLDASLRLLPLDHPAAAIRDAIAEDEDRLADLDMRPHRHVLALWRLADGVGLRALQPASAAFLDCVLAGEDPARLLGEGADLEALSAEVFTAPFARISPKTAC